MSRRDPILGCLVILLTVPTAPAAPPKKETVPWQVEPDPLPWKLDRAPAPDTAVKLPPRGKVIFPSSPSPYIALYGPGGKNEPGSLALYDLRTLEQVGKTVETRMDGRYIRVSPFGDLAACVDLSAPLPTVTLCSLRGETIRPSLQVWKEKLKIEALDFVGPGQILTVKEIVQDRKRKRLWEVWDVKTGEVVTSIHYQQEFDYRWIAWSPGRRYLVSQETSGSGYQLTFYDLRTGKRAGELEMQPKQSHWGQCGNLTFTPDGKELALCWRLHKEGILTKIMRFDMVNGRKIGELALRDEIRPSDPGFLAGGMRTFQFLPDGRGWLMSGHQIVDRETGAVVWAIDPRPKHIGETRDRRFADPYHVTTQTPDGKLKLIELPKAELDAAFKKAREAMK